MFKNFLLALVGIALCLTSIQANAIEYKAGVHYEIVSQQKTQKSEIREFFSFWCGHCFAMQANFKYLQDHYKGKVDFVLNPVSLLGGSMGPLSQQAYASALVLGVEDQFTKTLFSNMHIDGNIPMSKADFFIFFESIGIAKTKLEHTFDSFAVLGYVQSYNKATETSKIDAVPELVVNGMYKINMGEFETINDLVPLIDYLLTLN